MITDREPSADPVEGPPADRRATGRVLTGWAALLLVAGLASAGLGVSQGRGDGALRWPSAVVLLPAGLIAAAALIGVHRRVHDRAPWPAVLAGGYVVCVGWTLAIGLIAGKPTGSGDAPPLPGLLLAAMADLGADRLQTTVLLSLAGALVTPLVAIAVRLLCDESSARRLLPVLALAPYALIVVGNVESVAAGAGAGMLVLAVLASEPGRAAGQRVALAVLSGLLLGLSALLGYSAILLGAGTLCVFFVRRRPLLNVAAGIACLVPLLIAQSAGFDWTAGLADALRRDTGDHQVLLGIAGTLVAFLVLAGPAGLASVGSLRTTPGWPFLVAGVASLLITTVAGVVSDRLAPGAWLPGLPWLLVAATAPLRQGGRPVRTPALLVGVGVVTSYAVAILVHTVG